MAIVRICRACGREYKGSPRAATSTYRHLCGDCARAADNDRQRRARHRLRYIEYGGPSPRDTAHPALSVDR